MDLGSLAPGLVVAGKYVLQRPLARGAMGEVWVATHASLGGELALKFLARADAHDGEDEATAMARFRFEAQIAARLSRKTRHIVSVTDHGEEWGYAYLAMELVDGESLESMLQRVGPCAPDVIAPVVAQVAKGLAQAHAEGVFHRDLKPANVLLARDEDGALLVKILDFGIAKTVRSHKVSHAAQPGHSTEVGIVLGTPNYMSPEQARGLASLDHRCDLWSLAVVVYEALTGTLPYDGETTADLLVNVCSSDPVPALRYRPDLPPEIDEFFARAFAADVRDRFQDAASLASGFAAIAAIAEGRSSVATGRLRPVQEKPVPPPTEPAAAPNVAPTSAPEERSLTGTFELDRVVRPRRTGLFALVIVLAALAIVVVALRVTSSPTGAANAASAETATSAETSTSAKPKETAALEPTATETAVAPADPAPPQGSPKVEPTAPAPKKPTGNAPKPGPTSKPTPTPTPTPTPAPMPTTPKPVDKGEIL